VRGEGRGESKKHVQNPILIFARASPHTHTRALSPRDRDTERDSLLPTMKVLVGVKRALDYAARVRLRADGGGVDLAGARMSVNPFCEIALEVSERGGG